MEHAVGTRVRSFDREGDRTSYCEGEVIKLVRDDTLLGYPHYEIFVERDTVPAGIPGVVRRVGQIVTAPVGGMVEKVFGAYA